MTRRLAYVSVAVFIALAVASFAFAQGRGDLLRIAMEDKIHQPYRSEICPMLPRLLPLAGSYGILGAALSGAGPAVLVVVGGERDLEAASTAIHLALDGLPEPELHVCRFETTGARQYFESNTNSITV